MEKKMTLQLVKDLPLETRTGLTCMFCHKDFDNELQYGKFYCTDSTAAHYYCLLFSSGLEQKGTDNDGILGFLKQDIDKEVLRGRKLHCSKCKTLGATVGCCNKLCKKTYHFPCGVESRMLNQYFGAFNSYCFKHQPSQNINMKGYNVARARALSATATCTICHEDVPAFPNFDVLWAPCCKKQSWFHRLCMQKLALSAGYFFKCPICSNDTLFCSEMKSYGIYVPEQDASWELEPNAFQDLVQRHSKCDHPNCICPKGRQHDGDGTRWELLLCSSCGSKGVHIGCGRLDWSTMEWDCEDCSLQTRRIIANAEVRSPPRLLNPVTISSQNPVNISSQIPLTITSPPSAKRRRLSNDASSSSSESDIDIESVPDMGSVDLPTSPIIASRTPASRNVARRGRGSWMNRSRGSTTTRHNCNFDNLRFKVKNDDQIIVIVDKEQGSSVSYTIPVDQPNFSSLKRGVRPSN